jgi:hypothetical protein
MEPLRPKAADATFVAGQVYRLETVEERSAASHAHYFAALNEGWKNLREEDMERFPSSEHLRKWCLIRAGYRDEKTLVCSSKAEAQRVAAFVRPIDEYAVVTVSEAVVRVWTAKSQSMKAMGKVDFQTSKEAVLAIVAEMIGVAPDQLKREAA